MRWESEDNGQDKGVTALGKIVFQLDSREALFKRAGRVKELDCF